MSNFIARLVARSAGAPPTPGISMLAPRPVSRFEPIAAIDSETIADPEPPVAGPVAVETDEQARPAAAPTPVESRESRRPTSEVPVAMARPLADEIRVPRHEVETIRPSRRTEVIQTLLPDIGTMPQRTAVPDPAARAIAATPDHAATGRANTDAVSSQLPQPQLDAETFQARSPAPAKKISPLSVSESPREIHTTRSEQRVAVARANTPMVHDVKAEPPTAPRISIGKIEVQFLPNEPRLPVSRPQPERTRGFAAYARARRGEPR